MNHISHKLESWLAGELSARDAAEIQDHLTSCQECSSRAEELRQVWNLLGAMEDVEPQKPDIWSAVKLRTVDLDGEDSPSSWFFGGGPALRTGLAATAMAAGLALAFLFPAGQQSSTSVNVVAGLEENPDMQWIAESTFFGNDTGGLLDELWLGSSLENERGDS